jgi:hypothetical protein
MEEAAELGNYLPFSFKSPKERGYIEFLREAFKISHPAARSLFFIMW